MKIWITSDLHLNHENIIKYCNRPFNSIEEMNNTLIDNWNNVVAPEDVIICLGDFCLGQKSNVEKFVSRLNGNKLLVIGNHDRATEEFYRTAGFRKAVKKMDAMIYKDVPILFSHCPVELKEDGNVVNIHGHLHWKDKKDIDDRHFDASADRLNFTPILLDDIIKEKGWN